MLREVIVMLSLLCVGEVCGREVGSPKPKLGRLDSLMLKAYWHCVKKSSSCSDFYIQENLISRHYVLEDAYGEKITLIIGAEASNLCIIACMKVCFMKSHDFDNK